MDLRAPPAHKGRKVNGVPPDRKGLKGMLEHMALRANKVPSDRKARRAPKVNRVPPVHTVLKVNVVPPGRKDLKANEVPRAPKGRVDRPVRLVHPYP